MTTCYAPRRMRGTKTRSRSTRSRSTFRAWALIALAGPFAASAGEVTGTVNVRSDSRIRLATPDDALVVYVTGFDQPPPSQPEVISQKDKTFLPALRVVVAGQSVRFTNDDDVVHNVFSTSKARPFDLGKPPPGQTREVRFPTPGLVELYCNIHEQMSATLLVLPNRAFAFVAADGTFRIEGVPPGRYPVHVWGKKFEPVQAELTVPSNGAAAVTLTVTPRVFTPAHLDKYGQPYRHTREYPR